MADADGTKWQQTIQTGSTMNPKGTARPLI